jgi:hypothetical protein
MPLSERNKRVFSESKSGTGKIRTAFHLLLRTSNSIGGQDQIPLQDFIRNGA